MGDIREFYQDPPELLYFYELLRKFQSLNVQYELNEVRFKQVWRAYKSIETFFHNNDDVSYAKVSLNLDKIIKTFMTIDIETDYVAIRNISPVLDILRVADQIEIIPLVDDSVCISIKFLDVANIVGINK